MTTLQASASALGTSKPLFSSVEHKINKKPTRRSPVSLLLNRSLRLDIHTYTIHTAQKLASLTQLNIIKYFSSAIQCSVGLGSVVLFVSSLLGVYKHYSYSRFLVDTLYNFVLGSFFGALYTFVKTICQSLIPNNSNAEPFRSSLHLNVIKGGCYSILFVIKNEYYFRALIINAILTPYLLFGSLIGSLFIFSKELRKQDFGILKHSILTVLTTLVVPIPATGIISLTTELLFFQPLASGLKNHHEL